MGNTLLHTAASKAEPEVVKYLIRAGAALNTRAGEGWTPLHNAAGSNRVQAIELLLDAGADAGLEACGDGGTALAHALFYGHQEAAQLLASYALLPANLRVFAGLGRLDLLPALFDQEGTLSPAAYAGRGFYRHHGEYPEWTPSATAQEVLDEALVYASQNRQQEALSFLLDHGANASGMPYYASALHAAAYNGDVAMIDLLLLSGADPSVRDGMHGGTPADWAVHGTSPDVADRLLQPQTETETVPEPTTLFDLIEQGLQVQVQERLAQGADVHAIRSIPWEISGAGVTDLTQNLLQACASAGRPGIGALLAAAGAAVDLHAAAFLGDHQAVQMYIDGGQAVDDVDAFGMTALHRAIQGDSESTVDLLLRQGADVHHSADTYTFGARALHVAAASGASRQVIERLIEAGGDVSHAANPGTPMQIAQRASRGSTVMILRDLLGSS
ncbi:MAG: hypothetical protein HOH74_03990 [Gemmatimonadetes bacterium]|nr:hypothetical protein [Gemmatimonadota bacterium]